MKPIKHISGKIFNTKREIDLNVDGRNVVIIGGNGSGKTSLIKSLHKQLHNNIIQGEWANISVIERSITGYQQTLNTESTDATKIARIRDASFQATERLNSISTPLCLKYNDALNFIELYKNKKASIRYFEASRKADIKKVASATGSRIELEKVDTASNLGTQLEQHLVNLRVRAALGAQMTEKDDRAVEIQQWFNTFTDSLKYLFEDESTTLIFDADRLNFSILQAQKSPFNFQELSSGYLAILDIYADLLMRSAYLEITPSKLAGVILIDEIDVHLHVSLQRKIFPFLTQSFPNMQFIVTTHSPFVLTSVDDALIYDINTNTESTDLSMYSFEAVLEGILGVPPISKSLENTIKKITLLTTSDDFSISEAENTLEKIRSSYDTLDVETQMFYQLAVNKVLQRKSKEN